MVKNALDAAEASPVVNEVFWRAEAALVAKPTGGQAAGSRTVGTLAPATFLTDEEVARMEGGRLLGRPLQQLLGLQVTCSGLRPDERMTRMRRRDPGQQSLL